MENHSPKQQQVTRITRLLINVVVLVHLMFFLLEALLWMNPFVYTPLLDLLHNPVPSEYPLQALTLRNQSGIL
jgi:putative membrane protein